MRSLAKKDTGNYRVELVDYGSAGEEYALRVTYLGEWGSGDAVDAVAEALDEELDEELGDEWGEPETRGEADVIALRWFEALRGDHDVEELLAASGFDRFTNR